MPIYDYGCDKCGTTVEVSKSINDESKETCQTCGEEMRKLVSGSSTFQLKGGGWTGKLKPRS